MNKKLGLAVASALLAAASSANAGIVIPAGDWTLDIGGIVNTYYTSTRTSGDAVGLGGAGADRSNNITTGLLPNYLSVSGKTRQNDLDVGFTISINPGSSTTAAGKQGSHQENRQAFLTFGDKSWGSVKVGKDLGIFASDAILNDMTLLGVGSGAGILAGNTTTLGRIGTGFIYADWKAQIAYSSPNWNGFSFTGGITQAFDGSGAFGRLSSQPAFEVKGSYEWAGDVGGKVWASAISQKLERDAIAAAAAVAAVPGNAGLAAVAAAPSINERANAFDIGATINLAGFGLTGYYYDGKGIGQTVQFANGLDAAGNRTDSDGGYVQGTYVIPGVGTKLGLSWGTSNVDGGGIDLEDSMWTVGAYHPLTKHLNLVAEYSDVKSENNTANTDGKSKTISLGAIMFF